MPHLHEEYDYNVAIFIVHGGKVLLVNHPRYNKWLPPGGHIELDEDPEEALFREVKEETGLGVEILSTKPTVASPGTKHIWQPNYVEVHEANPPHKHIAFMYFARAENDKAVLSSEHTEIMWLSENELDRPHYNLSPSLIFYAKEAIKKEREWRK